MSQGEGSYTTLIETPLLDGQALPKQEHMILLGKDLESLGRWQRNCRTDRELMKYGLYWQPTSLLLLLSSDFVSTTSFANGRLDQIISDSSLYHSHKA